MIDPLAESLNSMNARELIRDVDIVLDGLDSPMARRIANRTCHNLGIPYIFGAAIEAFGSMSTILPGRTFCLECVMSGLRDEDLPKCGVVGVHPAVLGIVTAVQTSEAVLLLTGQGPRLLNKMLYMDLRNLRLDAVDLTRSEDCPVCGSRPHSEMEPVPDIFFEETCARDGRRNFVITPRERVCVDLQALKGVLEKRDVRLKTSSELGVTFRLSRDLIASILKSGIMIAQTPPDPRGDYGDKVWESYRSILVDGLGLSSRILPSRKKGD